MEPPRHVIVPAPGCRSAVVGSFLAQMDDLSRRLAEDTRDLTPDRLGWQPGPGMNTIGMLLAHNAIVEVFWTSSVLEDREPPFPYRDILGVGEDGDGMPLAASGPPPAALAGKALTFYDDLLERARANLRRVARTIDDEALGRDVSRKRSNGAVEVFNRRWVFYHLLEHFAGHYGQILMLKHQYRAAHPGG